MRVTVELDGASEQEGRPAAFQLGETRYSVQEVLDRWFGTESTYFKVRAGDGNLYILRQYFSTGEWALESFRREDRDPTYRLV